ncbi:hypothetical protein [Pseudomonas sp. LF245]
MTTIKSRTLLSLSLLWRTYVVYVVYAGVFGLVVGRLFSGMIHGNRNSMLLMPSIALVSFAAVLMALELAGRINLPRVIFGGRLKRSAGQWRTYLLHISLLFIVFGLLNGLLVFFAPADVWLIFRAYVGPVLFACGVFTIGLVQTPTAPAENSSATSSAHS